MDKCIDNKEVISDLNSNIGREDEGDTAAAPGDMIKEPLQAMQEEDLDVNAFLSDIGVSLLSVAKRL